MSALGRMFAAIVGGTIGTLLAIGVVITVCGWTCFMATDAYFAEQERLRETRETAEPDDAAEEEPGDLFPGGVIRDEQPVPPPRVAEPQEPDPQPDPEVAARRMREAAAKRAAERAEARSGRAASLLRLAKNFVRERPEIARRRLQEIVDDFPETEAAGEARQLLKGLD